MPTFRIKRHDTYPPLCYSVTDPSGNLDFTGGSATFTMVSKTTGAMKIGRAAASIDSATRVSYSWEDSDTDTVGEYRAEFEVVLASGKKLTIPNNDSLTVKIVEDLDDT